MKKITSTIVLWAILGLVFVAGTPASVFAKRPNYSPAQFTENDVHTTLDYLMAAYQSKQLKTFMKLVSPYFAGDDFALRRAVRYDFSSFDTIRINYTVNAISIDARGYATASVNYFRTVIYKGTVYNDRGTTQFGFHFVDGQVKLYSIKEPVLFGVTRRGEIATGIVQSAENNQVLVVNTRSGTATLKPVAEAAREGEAASVIRGTNKTVRTIYDWGSSTQTFEGWSFADNRKTTDNTHHYISGDFMLEFNHLRMNSGGGWQIIAGSDLAAVSDVPTSGYNLYPLAVDSYINSIVALKLASGKYAVIKIENWTSSSSGSLDIATLTFSYKYQTNGSNRF